MTTPPSRATIAIDPGLSGGFAAYPACGGPLRAHAMPDGAPAIVALMRELMAGADEVTVYLERVGGFVAGRERTGSSMFALGQNCGLLQGIAHAYDARLVLVTPQAWMKALGVGTRSGRSDAEWKRHLKARAQAMYPEVRVTLKNADALLILAYAREQEQVLEEER